MINFDKVERYVRKLKYQTTTGQIDQQTLKTRMMEMVDIAADGYYWMFGHESETWYQHDGQQWIPKDPGKLRLLVPQDDIVANDEDISLPAPTPLEQDLTSDWQVINWTWFLISLVVIALIAWIVFSSSLI